MWLEESGVMGRVSKRVKEMMGLSYAEFSRMAFTQNEMGSREHIEYWASELPVGRAPKSDIEEGKCRLRSVSFPEKLV